MSVENANKKNTPSQRKGQKLDQPTTTTQFRTPSNKCLNKHTRTRANSHHPHRIVWLNLVVKYSIQSNE